MRCTAGRARWALAMALVGALAATPAAGAAPQAPKGATAAPVKPRPLALTDAADKALRAELARRRLKPSAVEPQLEALRAADPWVALVRGAERIGGASAFAYMALDQAFAELGVPPEQRMALADTDDAGDQLAALGAQMKLFEDPTLGIPEPWRASFAQLALDLARARRLTAEALAGIDENERRETVADVLKHGGPGMPQLTLDFAPLARAAMTALLATDAFLSGRPGNMPPTFAWRTDLPGVEGSALGPFLTVAGPLYIGGVDRNTWSLPEHAVLVDLGGDDRHAPRPARTPALTGAELSVVVDLAGNDVYDSDAPATLGGGLFGLSFVRDEAGDDRYRGRALTQGSGTFGAGLLLDSAGDDVYEAEIAAQGAAHTGVGLLVDGSGDDLYVVGSFGQAAASASGVGALADLSGRDAYVQTTPAEDSDYVQGCARYDGARGERPSTGVLLDARGDDVYRAGDHSQAFASGEGWGLLIDGAGNDLFVLDELGQGYGETFADRAGVARGTLIDLGGDDVRLTAAGNAMATRNSAPGWGGGRFPTGVSVLLDTGGSDVLRCGEEKTGRGVAEGEGRALFIDLGVQPPVRIGLPPKPTSKPAPAPSGKAAK